MLNRMPAFMGRHPHGSNRGLVIYASGESHRIGAGIVVISALPGQTFYLYIVKPLAVQNSPGSLRPVDSGTVADSTVFAHSTVHQSTGAQAQNHTNKYQNISGIPINHSLSLLSLPQNFPWPYFHSQQEIMRRHPFFAFHLKLIDT